MLMFYLILFRDAFVYPSVEAREEELETSFVIIAKLVGDFQWLSHLTESTDWSFKKTLSRERKRRRTNGEEYLETQQL